jgi:hypothetical protein
MDMILPLFILSIPVACISWTFTHEELFRELHEYCVRRSKKDKTLLSRKFFYMLTCEYCFSHYVAIGILLATGYTIFFGDWRGYVVSFFSIVFIANIYMSLFGKIRIDIKKEKDEISKIEASL